MMGRNIGYLTRRRAGEFYGNKACLLDLAGLTAVAPGGVSKNDPGGLAGAQNGQEGLQGPPTRLGGFWETQKELLKTTMKHKPEMSARSATHMICWDAQNIGCQNNMQKTKKKTTAATERFSGGHGGVVSSCGHRPFLMG